MEQKDRNLLSVDYQGSVSLRYRANAKSPSKLVFKNWKGWDHGEKDFRALKKAEALKFAREIQLRFRDSFYGRATLIEEPVTEHGIKGLLIFLENGQLAINLPPVANTVNHRPLVGDYFLVAFGTPENPAHHVFCLKDKYDFWIDDSNLIIPEL